MSGQCLEIFDHINARMLPGLMHFIFQGFIPFDGCFFKEWFFFPFLFQRLNML